MLTALIYIIIGLVLGLYLGNKTIRNRVADILRKKPSTKGPIIHGAEDGYKPVKCTECNHEYCGVCYSRCPKCGSPHNAPMENLLEKQAKNPKRTQKKGDNRITHSDRARKED